MIAIIVSIVLAFILAVREITRRIDHKYLRDMLKLTREGRDWYADSYRESMTSNRRLMSSNRRLIVSCDALIAQNRRWRETVIDLSARTDHEKVVN